MGFRRFVIFYDLIGDRASFSAKKNPQLLLRVFVFKWVTFL